MGRGLVDELELHNRRDGDRGAVDLHRHRLDQAAAKVDERLGLLTQGQGRVVVRHDAAVEVRRVRVGAAWWPPQSSP